MWNACSEKHFYYDKYLQECSPCSSICDEAEQRGNVAHCQSNCPDYRESIRQSIQEQLTGNKENGEYHQQLIMPVVIVTLAFVVLLGMWISLLIYKKKIRRRRDVNRRVGEGANFLTHRTQVEDETDDDTFARPTIEETGESFVKSTVGESSVRGPGKSSVRGSGKETACVSGSVNINPEMSHGPSTTISIGLSDLPPFIGHPSDTGSTGISITDV